MWRNINLFFIIFIFFNCTSRNNQDLNLIYNNSLIIEGESHIKNISQLTFSGENAEAYFSPDGKKLIYQSHDGDSLCDQIYIMDIETGNTDLVSNGQGVTTCSFYQYPDTNKIIYSSTYQDDSACPPKPDYSMGYVWKLYPGYDIFSANVNGSNPVRLTSSPTYDAEATYSFDGKKIIYTSLKSGDLELWTMNPDGTNKEQLTDKLGYDGGAFYSHDGSKIIWRAYYPKTEKEISDYKYLLSDNSIGPMALQLWVMNADGSNKKQITNNGSANFGPFFFPKDNKIIFSSNMHDLKRRDFDLYSVNIDGSGLERITYFDGFDGFPMFSPNGKYLVFASNRNQKDRGDTNLFICEWK
jgi:Tol biopolymer transport system component